MKPNLLVLIFFFIVGCKQEYDPLNEPVSLPQPTGVYAIGTRDLNLVDLSREESLSCSDSPQKRALKVRLWYPVVQGTAGQRKDYTDARTAVYFAESIAEEIMSPKARPLHPDFRLLIHTHALQDAPIADDGPGFPVLVFSPGYGTSCTVYQSFFEDLASNGYVVAAIDHPFVSGITVSVDDRVCPPLEPENKEKFLRAHLPTMIADISFVIDRLQVLNDDTSHTFYNRFDMRRIASFGHSYGGAVAVQACLDAPNIVAAINIDGSLWGDGHLKPNDKPMLIINNNASRMLDATTRALWKNSSKGYMARISSTRHYDYSDMPLLLKHFYPEFPTRRLVSLGGFGSLEPALAIEITRKYILSFFNQHLNGGSVEQMVDIAEQYPGKSVLKSKP
jgi:pimeloyl-ACP methyl ester carboxylesterase